MIDSERAFISKMNKTLSPPSEVFFKPEMMPAAVLVPVVFRGERPHLIFTLRTMTVAHHKGQISFPGGAADESDEGPVETALREASEEIGLSPEFVRPLGCLPAVATVSSFWVVPVVGLVIGSPPFSRNPDEVAEIFELPLSAFERPSCHTTQPFQHGSVTHMVHHYEIGARDIWGITGGIVHALLERLGTGGSNE